MEQCSHGCCLLECRLYHSFSCKLGGFFCLFLAWSSTVCIIQKLTLLTLRVPRWVLSRSRRCGNAFLAGRAPALPFSCLDVPGFGVSKVQFLSSCSPWSTPGCWEPGTAFHQKLPILCCFTFPEKTPSIFQSWQQVLPGQSGQLSFIRSAHLI